MNIEEIRKWHKIFKRDDELFEIRLLGDKTYSGYFYDVEQAIEALKPYDTWNIYFSVNEVKRACASRSQYGRFQQVKGTATSKQDIEHRWYLPIDVDCERPSGVSSTDAEKELAHQKAGAVYRFLKENGFCEPIVCDSSSGYHIFIPIDMENTLEAEQTIKNFLEILGSNFTDEHVKIDNVLFDANRIIRLPGSFGRKGRSTEERPHRQARILSAPDEIVRVNKAFIDAFNEKFKIVTEQPANKNYNYSNGNREEFNLRKFISDHNISIAKEVPLPGGGTKYVLTECPFDSGHKNPDSAIFEMPNGAVAFKCFHQSCSHHDWHELRLMFEPNAYDPKPQTNFNQPQRQYQPQPQPVHYQPVPEIKPEIPELGKKWFSMKDITKVNVNDLPHVKTGFTELDRRIKGLFFGSLMVLSGSNSSGKSSWLNTLILNFLQQNEKCALWSGELRPDVLKAWIQMVAAGARHLNKSDHGSYYFVNDMIGTKIDRWMDGKFFLYNNEYSNKWEQIFADMRELLKLGVKIFILDNLFSMDIDIFGGDNNKQQKDLVNQITEFCKKEMAIVILVAHPRKTSAFIRKIDISGNSNITDAASYVAIMHRVNQDFRRSVKEVFPNLLFRPDQNSPEFNNMLEIAKDRMMGVQDYFCGMYYEFESRRFKNTMVEQVEYGWRDDIGVQMSFEEPAPEAPIVYDPPQTPIYNTIPFSPPDSNDEPPF